MANTKEGKHTDTIIGKETVISGSIKAKGGLRTDGQIVGNVTVSDTFSAGSSAQVKGDVRCRDAFIAGRIEGNVYAQGKVEMNSGAYLTGDITCRGLVIQDNVFFEGRCSMKEKEQTTKK